MIELGRWAMPESVLNPGASDEAILDWCETELREPDRQANSSKPKAKARKNSSADDGEER